jgi:SrtB family sortase
MKAEIISVGAEVISGDVSNTDASFLSQRLSQLGVKVTRHTVVDDKPESITEALAAAVARSPMIIFTGGLGPTADDMTKEIVCQAVGMELVEHAESMGRLEEYFKNKEEEMPEINRKQALFPKDAVVFENTMGTADGCAIESGNQCIIMLPGPPKELETMFETSVEDYLLSKIDGVVVTANLKVFGMSESKIAQEIAHLLNRENPVVATYVEKGDIRIKITVTGENQEECEATCKQTEDEIREKLGSYVYAGGKTTLQETVVNLLIAQEKKLATAESCTAGMLSEMLTDVSGASQVFEFGVSAYANHIKQEMLGVPAQLLEKHGAVSYQVAEAMAKGAATKGKANFGIGITGIAGPTGGTKDKPVGLVYVSLYDGVRCFTRKLTCNPESSREKIRLTSVMNALDMIRLYLVGDETFLGETPIVPVEKKWWQKVFPVKGDSAGEMVRKIALILCVAVFFGALGYIVDYFYQSYANHRHQEKLVSVFHQPTATINQRFEGLLAINKDTVGWITIPNTQCDNPVVQTTDNDKYLDTTFEGEKSKYGTLYADKNCNFTAEGLSQNTIIYGHHMKDGTMFGELKQYRDYEFYKKNPVFQFTYLYDTQTVNWKVAAVFIIDAQDKAGRFFRTEFSSQRQFNEYYNEIKQRSVINTGVDLTYTDKLLTLCTCTYEFDDARLLVVARQVREGESVDVDLSKTSINKNAVHPAVYYEKTKTQGPTEIIPYVEPEISKPSNHVGRGNTTSKQENETSNSSGGSSWYPQNNPSRPSNNNGSGQSVVTPTDVR